MKLTILLLTLSRSRKGAWIEIMSYASQSTSCAVAPVRERGLKGLSLVVLCLTLLVAPVRERGLKAQKAEIKRRLKSVAPVRERGLKVRSARS